MTKEFANFLQICAAESGHDLEIRDAYSGRGMGDKTTVAVITDDVAELMCDVIDYFKGNSHIGDAVTTYYGVDIPEPEPLRRDNCAQQIMLY